MIFDGIVLLLVLIMTSYLATQGTLSSLWTLIAAGFASLIAMGTFEPAALYISKWKPDYARGVAFLCIFFVAFLICKLLGDNLVPRNVRLPKALDRGIGAIFGFLTGLLAVGTTALGIEMLPFRSQLLGYDRFDGAKRMEGPTPGTVAQPNNLWLNPESVTMTFWNLASGRGLGGNREFASVHPNLADESYGYRNVVQYGQHETLVGGLTVTGAYLIPPSDTTAMQQYHIESGKEGYVVRCEIEGGADEDAYFRLSASEIRLVTDKNQQYYPIGYMEKGTVFTPVDLANGNVVDDEGGGKTLEEWVFQFDPGQKPEVLEIKGLARADLSDVNDDKPMTAVAATLWPKKDYKQTEGTITVTVKGSDQALAGIHVLLCRSTAVRSDLTILPQAYDKTLQVISAYNSGNGSWKDPPPAHTYYPEDSFKQAQNMMRGNSLAAPDTAITLRDQLPHMYLANSTANVEATPGLLQTYTDNNVIPTLKGAQTNIVITDGVTDASGKVTLEHCPKGTWMLFAAAKDGLNFYMWDPNVDVKPKDNVNVTLQPSSADFRYPAP